MLIDFSTLEEQKIPHFRNGEKVTTIRMFTDPLGKVMSGSLEPGASIGMHTHETSSEVIYILSGDGKVICDGETEIVHAGSCHFCPKGHTHSLINDSGADLTFFAVIPEQ